MRTAYRCRAYPDPEQAALLSRTFGCVRLVWNKTLCEQRHAYRVEGKKMSYRETDAALTSWKKTEKLSFLSEVSSVPLQQSLRHLQAAFQNFFAGRARYPRFKSRAGRQSAHYTRSAFRMRKGALMLAKTSAPLRFVWSFDEADVTELDPTMVVVSHEPDDRWYVTFAVDTETPAPVEPTGHAIGVDLGLSDLLVTSDGAHIAKSEGRRAHRKVRDARQDFLHRHTTALVRSADLIAIEDLNVTGMVRNRRLARAIYDAAWGEFRRQLEYKCKRTGRALVVIDRWYPSSKTCSACGHRLADLALSTRRWTCPSCRTRHDRDLNAAKNILAAGRAVIRDISGDACGADVRRQGPALPRSAVKQEARAARHSA